MKMTFRWFGQGDDSVTLEQIRQIPGRPGIVGMIADIPAGEVWPKERIAALKKCVTDAGLSIEVIESVNIHDSIKTGGIEQKPKQNCIFIADTTLPLYHFTQGKFGIFSANIIHPP